MCVGLLLTFFSVCRHSYSVVTMTHSPLSVILYFGNRRSNILKTSLLLILRLFNPLNKVKDINYGKALSKIPLCFDDPV